MKYDLEARVFKDTALSASEKLVLLALVFHLHEASGQCNPSNPLLQEECDLSGKGLKGILTRLHERGQIKWTRCGHKNEFELFPTEENRNGVPVSGEPKPERASTFGTENRNGLPLSENVNRNGVPVSNEQNRNGVPQNRNAVPLHPYELLGTISSSTTTNETNSVNCVSRTGAAAQAKPSANHSASEFGEPDALTSSLCEACALMPDALGEKHRRQLLEVTAWLLSVYPDADEAAREVAVRFSAWDRSTPPHPPQIKADWNRLGRIVARQNQPQNSHVTPNETASERQFRQLGERRAARRNGAISGP